MNTGQMLLVICALCLLSLLALSINQMVVGQTQVMLDSEASLNAVSIAQSLLDEIETKLYDDTLRSVRVFDNQLWKFEPVNALGPATYERVNVPQPDAMYPHKSIRFYDDVDDYNGYIRIDTTSLMNGFRDSVAVYYVQEASPDVRAVAQTCFKRIDVTVTHPSMKKPLTLSDVAIYRKFF